MDRSDLNRRDFNRLAMAAFGGALAGSTVGCSPAPAPAPAPAKPVAAGAGASATDESALASSVAAVGVEKHVCRGLNACKNQGGSGMNDCAGQGICATVAKHSCGTQNECKGQGGCNVKGVENDCKGQGGCHVPLMDDVWAKARKIFEAKMKKAGTEFGAAPAETKA